MDPSLVDVRRWMTRYLMSLILVLGLLGNMTNVWVFTRKDFLNNSCCLYLFATSILNLFIISWGIIPSIYNLDHVDPSTYSFTYCKLRLYTAHTLLMIGRSLIVLACIDRYALCSASRRLRSLTQPKIATRSIIATLLIWPLLTLHIPVLQKFTGTRCTMSGAYVLVYSVYATMAAGLCPPVLMSIFSALTIRHRRQLHTKLNAARKNNRRDHGLMVMLLSEVIVYVMTNSLYPAITLYLAITNQQKKDAQRTQNESFVNYLGGSFLIYLNSSSTFFVYVASSQNFRRELKQAIMDRYRRMAGRGAQVDPLTTQVREGTQFNRSHQA